MKICEITPLPLWLIHKPPLYPEPQDISLCRIMWCRKIIVDKPKTIFETHRVEIFRTDICGKPLDPEMKESAYIGKILDRGCILWHELPDHR